jgi:hypothetical protein
MGSIRRLEVARFRGVPKSLRLDTCASRERSVSLLLIGDNGSGKSTIVDALEFGLQGRIGRASALHSSMVPAALSLYDPSGALVRITLDTREIVERRITTDEEGKPVYNHAAHPQFALSPLVLRRADILQFWHTPDEQKQLVFFDYFRSTREPGSHATPAEVRDAEDRLWELKRARRKTWQELAARRGPAAFAALSDDADLEAWITAHVYAGVGSDARKALKARGTPLRVPVIDHKLVWTLREQTQLIGVARREVKALRKRAKAGQPTPKAAATRKGLESVSAFVTEAFSQLSSAGSYVDSISVDLGTLSAVSLTITVQLRNGSSSTPRKLFSEANLDLLALLIYTAIAAQAASRGQAKVLVFDDVFQSIDGAARFRTVDYLLERLPGWQFIFTVHDRLWAEQLRQIFRSRNAPFTDIEIRRWSFDAGPVLVDAERVPNSGLRAALVHGEPYQICAEAGLLLERIAHHLSYALPISVTRRRGDKYTLGDLWPGVLKALRRTTVTDTASAVERWIHLRNMLGAHYNEWAESLSRDEAHTFGTSVLALSKLVWCAACRTWVDAVRRGNDVSEWRCKCGARALVPKNAVQPPARPTAR